MKKPLHILFKFPSRSRPEKFFKGLDNILANIADQENYTIAATLDADDTTMYNKNTLMRLKEYMNRCRLMPVFGSSTSKINAVNRDMDKFPNWDIVVVMSDDMEFTVPGFDNIIREKFELHFPDTNGNIHFYDGFQDRVSTMTMMGRVYFESPYQDKHIYQPCYYSVYCDEEYTEVAKRLRKMAYYSDVIFMHKHPANGHGTPDELLKHTESFFDTDKVTYMERHSKNFFLEHRN